MRLLVKRPLFTLVTVLVLTGGLGISLYTFAALKTMVYRDLPVPDGGSIVTVGVGDGGIEPLEAFELAALHNEAENLSELGVFRSTRALIGEPGSSRTLRSVESDSRIFEFTRTQPLLGRGFVPEDGANGSEPVAVLSHSAWQTVFAGDATVVGRLVPINGRRTLIVGVMPERYAFPTNTEIWLPLADSIVAPAGYSGIALEAYARIRSGVAHSTAEVELTTLLERVRQQLPDDVRQPAAVSVMNFQEEVLWGFRHRDIRRPQLVGHFDSADGGRQRRQPAARAHERQLVIGLALSALLSAAALFAIGQGFSVGAATLTSIAVAVVLVVSATVLLSIYFAVHGIARFEPGVILRS